MFVRRMVWRKIWTCTSGVFEKGSKAMETAIPPRLLDWYEDYISSLRPDFAPAVRRFVRDVEGWVGAWMESASLKPHPKHIVNFTPWGPRIRLDVLESGKCLYAYEWVVSDEGGITSALMHPDKFPKFKPQGSIFSGYAAAEKAFFRSIRRAESLRHLKISLRSEEEE